jgi:hypothetical protein
MNASGFCAETIANRQAAAYATPKKSEVGPHPPRDGTTDPATSENPTHQSIALSVKNDGPFHSSDDGFPSCVGYCPKTIADRKKEGYFVTNSGSSIPPSSLAVREKNDVPAHSSDDGYASCKGYCPKTIAEREKANKPFPMDYKVPDLGLDHDIIATAGSIKDAEKITGDQWKVKKDKDGKWVLAQRVKSTLGVKCSSDDGDMNASGWCAKTIANREA